MEYNKKNIVILTGAGISKESGIPTFRDSIDGLWYNYKIEDVATHNAWEKNPKLVLDFFNERRRQLEYVEPNEGHKQLVLLEDKYNVNVVTQNVDNLHEKAGSKNILHIHGILTQAISSENSKDIIDISFGDINIGDLFNNKHQLRPNVVLFGENVYDLSIAKKMHKNADILIIIGTSLVVEPVASLIRYSKQNIPIYVVNPETQNFGSKTKNITHIQKNATEGVKEVVEILMNSIE